MCAAVSPSDAAARRLAGALAPVRAEGGITAMFEQAETGTTVRTLSERGGYRLRFPRSRGRSLEAVIINTGGGVVGGDRVAVNMAVAGGGDVVVTTAAAERVYRSILPAAEVDIELAADNGARLAWLPQETILFSGARLRRRFEVDLHPTASALLTEAVVFGRLASSETVRHGLWHDVWRVRRGGRLLFAEATRIDGTIADLLARPAIAAGARAVALVLYVAADAEMQLVGVRETLAYARSLAAASAWNGMLAARFLAAAPESLRSDVMRVIERLAGAPMPRLWST